MTYKSWLKQYADGEGVLADFAARAISDAKETPKLWDFPSNRFEGRYQDLKEHLIAIGANSEWLAAFRESWDEWQKAEKKAAAERRKQAKRRTR